MPNAQNIKKLLLEVSAGSKPAFEALVTLFWLKVYRNTLALTKSAQTAEELTQDIFLKIWQTRSQLATIDNFEVYIYVIGRNKTVSALRKKILEMHNQLPDDIPESSQLPDLQFDLKEMNNILHEGISQMPPMRKKVFELNRNEGLTYEEIAEKLNISRNTVKEHMVNARAFLRGFMQQKTGKLLPVYALLWALLNK